MCVLCVCDVLMCVCVAAIVIRFAIEPRTAPILQHLHFQTNVVRARDTVTQLQIWLLFFFVFFFSGGILSLHNQLLLFIIFVFIYFIRARAAEGLSLRA